MRFFMFVVLIQVPCRTTGECMPLVLVSHNRSVDVASGSPFNLTCHFTCISEALRVQLLKNGSVWMESRVSSSFPSLNHNISLFLNVPAAQRSDATQYKCQSHPKYVVSGSVKVNVREVVTSTMKPPCEPSSPPLWTLANAPMWYLLGKMAVFIACWLTAALRSTC